MSAGLPLVVELPVPPHVEQAVEAFACWPGLVLFDSALVREPIGRYSFLTADPFQRFLLQQPQYGHDPFHGLRDALCSFHSPSIPGLPPFQGGAAGLLSYELSEAFERLPRPAIDEFRLPALATGLYDWVLAWDHVVGCAWIISQGFPEQAASARLTRAAERLRCVQDRLTIASNEREANSLLRAQHSALRAQSPLAPQWPLPGLDGLTSNFARDAYLKAVERVIEYIRAGDVFQANLSQRLLFPAGDDDLTLYNRLRQRNPAPFAGLVRWDDWAVLSASPERFVSVGDGGEVETRPIKGTRRRQSVPEADLFTRDELRESAKDQAENVMIVDLLRNDLSRVCRPGSLHVPKLCAVETYETVQHLVSVVRGRLSAGRDALELLSAMFPGGSITGAPKIRAMQIIAELEPTVRGPYCGSLFYVGFDGRADSNILIRTFIRRHGWLQCPVGGGIVARSDPDAEYDETLHKAEGMLRALR